MVLAYEARMSDTSRARKEERGEKEKNKETEEERENEVHLKRKEKRNSKLRSLSRPGSRTRAGHDQAKDEKEKFGFKHANPGGSGAGLGAPSVQELAVLDDPEQAHWLDPSTSKVARGERERGGVTARGRMTLPPEVEGLQRGELMLRLGPLELWGDQAEEAKAPVDEQQGRQSTRRLQSSEATVSFRFWGQEGLRRDNLVTIQTVCPSPSSRAGKTQAALNIPLLCSPANFMRYLEDSQPLQVDVSAGDSLKAGMAEVDLSSLHLKKPLRATVPLARQSDFRAVGQLEIRLEINYSLISSFELNEHIAQTDMSLPLFPVSDLDLNDVNDQELGKLLEERIRSSEQGAATEGGEGEEEEDHKSSLFGWGPGNQFKRAQEKRETMKQHSTFLNNTLADSTNSNAQAFNVVEPTWDSVLSRAEKLSTAMMKAVGGKNTGSDANKPSLHSNADVAFGSTEQENHTAQHMQMQMQVNDLSPCPSLTFSEDDMILADLESHPMAMVGGDDNILKPKERSANTAEQDDVGTPKYHLLENKGAVRVAEDDDTAGSIINFTIENETPAQDARQNKIQMTLRVKDIHLVSKNLQPSRIIIAVKSALCDPEEASRFTFTAHSIKQQGRLLFQMNEGDLKSMPQDKLLLSVELWQIRDKRHTVLVDGNSCNLIGLATFSLKDILESSNFSIDSLTQDCIHKTVSISRSKSIVDLLQDSCTGNMSMKFEFKSLQHVAKSPDSPGGNPSELSVAREGLPMDFEPELELKSEAIQAGGSRLTDHIFEVTVEKASGLKLVPGQNYFLSYTFQSSEDAEPLCTNAMPPKNIMEINAKACHTITLPQSETVLMNIGSFHGQNLGFELRSISKDASQGASWHATGSLDFMELVELACSNSNNSRTEKAFVLPLKLNEEFYSPTLRKRSSPILNVKIAYMAEAHEEEAEVAKEVPVKHEVVVEERQQDYLCLPERNVIADDVDTLLEESDELNIEALEEDEQANLDLDTFQITGSNSMKAKVDFTIGKVCGLRTMISSATHNNKRDSSILKGAMKFGPNTFISVKFAPEDSYFQEFLPETSTDFKAENWIPDFEFFRSYKMYLSPSTVNLMTRENIEVEVWHYTPSRQIPAGAGAGNKILLGICKIPWSNVLTCPRGIYGLHTVVCPKLQTPVGAIEINVTLQMRSYMLQNSSILESCDPVREMLPEEFVEHNRKSIELFTGKYANFIVAVDNVTVSASDTPNFNHKLRYCIAMSVNGFMGETVSKAMHPQPSTHQRMWERLNLSHKAFKSFKVDKFFEAAINNSPLTVTLLECDNMRNDVEIAFGDIDLSQLLLERNGLSETSRMISGTYTLVPIKRDYIEIRVRVKILLKGTPYSAMPVERVEMEAEEEAEADSLGWEYEAAMEAPSYEEEISSHDPVMMNVQSRSDEELEELTENERRSSSSQVRQMMSGEVAAEVITLIESQDNSQGGESNDALVCIEDALHINSKLAASTSSDATTYAYVTFAWPQYKDVVCSSLATCLPEAPDSSKYKCKWYFTKHLSFKDFSEQDPQSAHSIILQVWSRSMKVTESLEFSELDMPVVPSSSSDSLIGSAVVDMTTLSSGLDELHGWYNICDYNQNCCGQLKVRISLLNGQKSSGRQVEEMLSTGFGLALDDQPHHTSSSSIDIDRVDDDYPRQQQEEYLNDYDYSLGDEEPVNQGSLHEQQRTLGLDEEMVSEDPQSAVDFHEYTRGICSELGSLEEKILSLSPSDDGKAKAKGGISIIGGREEATEREAFLSQNELNELTSSNFPSSAYANIPQAAALAEDYDYDYGQAGTTTATTSSDPNSDPSHASDSEGVVASQHPGFNFDRLARILSA